MGKINTGRVILGGLFAGLIINAGEFLLNGVLVRKEWEDAMRAIGKQAIGNQAVAVFLALGFLIGVSAVWIYAAIRPRFGPGPKTAVCAGLIVWVLASFYAAVGALPTAIFPTRLLVVGTIWELVQLPIATLAGAWLYKEES